MVRVSIPLTQYSSGSTALLILIRLLTCPMLAFLSKFIPALKCFHSGVPRQQFYSGYQSYYATKKVLFLLHITPHCFFTSSNLGLSRYTLLKVQIDTLKYSTIVRCSEYDLFLFSYLPPILTTFLVYRIVLILILLILPSPLCQDLVVLISPLAPCILSLIPIHAGYFDYQLGG